MSYSKHHHWIVVILLLITLNLACATFRSPNEPPPTSNLNSLTPTATPISPMTTSGFPSPFGG